MKIGHFEVPQNQASQRGFGTGRALQRYQKSIAMITQSMSCPTLSTKQSSESYAAACKHDCKKGARVCRVIICILKRRWQGRNLFGLYDVLQSPSKTCYRTESKSNMSWLYWSSKASLAAWMSCIPTL
eukprot:6465406-Amphidinium_carterae.1